MSGARGLILEGTLYFNRLNDSGVPTGRKKIAGITKMEIKTSSDIKELTSRDKGSYGQIVDSVAVPKPTELSATIQQWDAASTALAFMGDSVTLTEASGTVTDEVVVAKVGVYVALDKRNVTSGSVVVTNAFVGACTFTDTGDLVTANSHGFVNGQVVKFSVVTTTTGISADTNYYVIGATTNTFQVSATKGGSALTLTTDGTGTIASPTYTEGTDYEINYTLGDLLAIDGGLLQDGMSLKVDYAHSAISGWKMSGGTNPRIKGELVLDGRNLADGSTVIVTMPRVLLASNTGVDLLKNDFNDFSFDGRAELVDGKTSTFYFEYY